MKNRVLTLAAAMAMAAAGMAKDSAFAAQRYLSRDNGRPLFGPVTDSPRPKRTNGGRTVAQDKRDARKRRNVLRARGRHRAARR